jgi:hypothetical protein
LMLCTMGMWGDFSITGGLLLPRFKSLSYLYWISLLFYNQFILI